MTRRQLPFAALVALLCAGAIAAGAPAANAADTVVRTLDDRTVHVRTPHMPRGVSAKAATVIDAARGRALWSMHAHEQRLIASTTKMMTALVAISRTRPNQVLKATRYHGDAAESVIGLRPGERMTAEDLLRGLLIASANDAADTFAIRLAGSRSAFVAAMNRRARALGLRETRFGNAIGLDTPRTVSSAHDLARLAAAAMREPRFKAIVGRKRATLRSGSVTRRIENTNKLIGRHGYVDGIKTGHTLKAGYLLVASASKADAGVISVVMGEPTEAARERDSIALLRYGRAFFKPVRPLAKRRAVTELPVALQDTTAAVYPRRDVSLALRDGERIALTLAAPEELQGPLAAGSRVGTATVRRNDRVVTEAAVYLREAIPAPPLQAVLLHLLWRMLPWLLLVAIVIMIGVMLLRRRARRVPENLSRATA